jgi:DNA-binding protein YbaB
VTDRDPVANRDPAPDRDRASDRDLGGLRAYAAELSQQYKQLRTGLQAMQAELAAVTGTAKSADGFVTATVGPRGQLIKLELDGRIYRRPDSAKLAETITDTIHRATTDAAAKVEAVSVRHAPDADVASYLRGQLADRFARFDFIQDELTGGAQ